MKYIFSFFLLLSFLPIYSQNTNLTIDTLEGATPWSNLNINDKPGQFQFAIVTDRTGGHRPGVFMEGIRKLNLMQPEFVMSVGDLIEGYTEDRDQLNREWNEFDGFIDSLDMPFFYLPGNHDITNKVMEDVYLERFGKTHYHFVYNEVLFLCLNSEDTYQGAGKGTISDSQFTYIKETLATHSDAKWTLVFMHQPMWTQDDPSRWFEVEKLLESRKHTVYTGHVHHYVKYDRNNGKYYTLGTTGGGSSLRGTKMGEFDHVSWITMTEEGPIMANLLLDGIQGENVSTEKTREYAMGILESDCIQIDPLFVEGETFTEGTVKIKLTNDKDTPMQVKFKESFSWDLKGELDRNEVEVAPNSVEFVTLSLESKKKDKPFSDMKSLRLHTDVKYLGENLPDFSVPMPFVIGPEKKYPLLAKSGKIKVDGNLTEWKSLPYSVWVDDAEEKDISATFGISYDKKYVYVATRIKDDDIQTDTASAVWNQDFIGIILSGDPMMKSAIDRGEGWYENTLLIMHAPGTETMPGIDNLTVLDTKGIQSNCKMTEDGYLLELAIPVDYLIERQGKDWKTLRMNIVIQDEDKGEKDKPRYFFRPEWRGENNRVGSGMFFRE